MSAPLYPHILAAVFNRPWAIHEDTMQIIVEVLKGRVDGVRLTQEDIEARLVQAAENAGPRQGPQRVTNVEVLPMYGVLSPRAGLMAQSSGGTSVEGMRKSLRRAMKDDEIGAVVLDIDSPGGAVDGIPELAAEIRAARDQKPIVALANTSAFSAAYWLGSQASEFYASPSASVGSIGVLSVHEDHSERFAKEGVRPTIITSAEFKAEGNRANPLSDVAREAIQHEVDAFHEMFTGDVALGRSTDREDVESNFGKGRTIMAKEAISAGMIDDIATFEQAISRAGDLAVARVEARSGKTYTVDITNHSSATDLYEFIAETSADVVLQGSSGTTAGPLPFAIRLERVLAEAEALALHAKERKVMRAGEGRLISTSTREQLAALSAELASIASDVQVPAKRKASVASLEVMLRSYQLEG
jgi:signal peptide peptidase SppA